MSKINLNSILGGIVNQIINLDKNLGTINLSAFGIDKNNIESLENYIPEIIEAGKLLADIKAKYYDVSDLFENIERLKEHQKTEIVLSNLIAFFLRRSGTRAMPNLYPRLLRGKSLGNKTSQLNYLFDIYQNENNLETLLQVLVDNLSKLWDDKTDNEFNNLISPLGLKCDNRKISNIQKASNLNELGFDVSRTSEKDITKGEYIIKEMEDNLKETKNLDEKGLEDSNTYLLNHMEEKNYKYDLFKKSYSKTEGLIFVLMPFKPDKLKQIYERYIKKPLKRLGYNVKRADENFTSVPIMEDIWESICKAELIIADLTNQNPNVFYELGLCHLKGKYVIHICQDGSKTPFDVNMIRIIFYRDDPEGYEMLKKQVINYIKNFQDEIS